MTILWLACRKKWPFSELNKDMRFADIVKGWRAVVTFTNYGVFLVHHQTVWRDRFWPLLFSFFYFFGTWCSTMNEKSPFLYVPWGVKNCRGFGIPTHPQEVYKGHFLGNGQLLRNLISFWETSFRTLCVLWWIPSWQRKVLSVS